MDETIYRELKGDLIRYATVLVGPSDAEDVLSTVIARVYKSRRALTDLESPRPYLMKAVFNEAMDRKRQKRMLPLVDQAVEPADARPDVFHAVVGLPIQQRAAIYLSYWVGMTSDEAARHMGCGPATVRRYLHLAKKKLERVLDA